MKYMQLPLLFFVVLYLFIPVSVLASNRMEHDKQLERIVFGRENYYASQPKNQKKAVEALECAVFLCIDQYNNTGNNDLRTLKEYGVPGLPENINAINYTAGYDHRKYTHIGWVPIMHPEKGEWNIRKEILLSTVNKVFDFGLFTDVNILGLKPAYTPQCDAFSALLYYIHILEDLAALKDYGQYKLEGAYVLPLARAHADTNSPDILWDLTTLYFPNLFSKSVKESFEYNELMQKSGSLAQSARSLVQRTGGIYNEERFLEYKNYTLEFLLLLQDYIPRLLRKESFFTSIFPPE